MTRISRQSVTRTVSLPSTRVKGFVCCLAVGLGFIAVALAFDVSCAFTRDAVNVHRSVSRVQRLCLDFISEVSHRPFLGRNQVRLDDNTQLIVFFFELLSDQRVVLRKSPRSPSHRRLVFDPSRSSHMATLCSLLPLLAHHG